MRRIFLTFILACIAMPAMAQDIDTLCRYVSPGAAYQPGIDSRGRPVAPVNAAGGQDITPDIYRIPLTIDLAGRLNLPVDTDAQSVLGWIEVDKAGRVTYNGRDITGQSSAACGAKRPAPMPVMRDGAASAPASPSRMISLSHRDHGPMLRHDDTSDPQDMPRDRGVSE